jgi:DNA-binding MarR family transcriptional regulator
VPRRLDTSERPPEVDRDVLMPFSSGALSSLVRIMHDWMSSDMQGNLVNRAGISLEAADVPALFTLGRLGPLNPTNLAKALKVSPVTISRTLDRFSGLGYAVRVADPADARSSIVVLTAAGGRAAAALYAEGESIFSELLEGWREEDRMVFERMLLCIAERSERATQSR